MPNWYEVDKEGLANLLEARGKAFALYELVQNAWDTNASQVEIRLEKVPGKPQAKLSVLDDDPDGFQDITHAFTFYAPSSKKDDPSKRGIFNEGEKLFLALCLWAEISTTKGTVTFDNKGRHHSRRKRDYGSSVQATMRMNQEEFDECVEAMKRLMPPKNVKTYFNGELLEFRAPEAVLEATLPTTKADENGVIRPTKRQTQVFVYEPEGDEVAFLFEKGIPVVETGDKYHVDVQQRVPLNRDRNNVTPAYLRQLRTLVLNEMFRDIDEDEASEAWVREGLSDKNVNEDAFKAVQKKRLGDKAVIFTPGDPEANNIAMSKGYNVIGGRSMSKGEHENNRRFQAILPASQVTPSPKPFHEDGDELNVLDRDQWTNGMVEVSEFAKKAAEYILDSKLRVIIADDPDWGFAGCYKRGELTMNKAALGKRFFSEGITPRVLEFLIHEFAHHYASNHLSSEFYDACCRVGARFAFMALDNKKLFK